MQPWVTGVLGFNALLVSQFVMHGVTIYLKEDRKAGKSMFNEAPSP